MRFALLIPPMLLLAACGQAEEKTEKTEVSINAGGEGGGVQITAGKDGGKIRIGGDKGAMSFDLPDFANIDVNSDFDIDGVKLYPGSKIASINVDAHDRGGAEKAMVKLGFTSPAAPAKAADWMAGEFAKKGVSVARAGDTLTGKNKDGDDFTIAFRPDGGNARGDVTIVSK